MIAKQDGKCIKCNHPIKKNMKIVWYPEKRRARHEICTKKRKMVKQIKIVYGGMTS
jgi:transcription initiation factor IIE alpha subunit